MEKNSHFGFLTSRMDSYRESVLTKKPYICSQRALLVTEVYQQNQHLCAVMKRALMLQNILEKMDIYIEDQTLIVGNQASSNNDAPVFPEYTLDFVIKELDLFEKRDGDVFYITEQTKKDLRSIAPFWENNNLRSTGGALLPDKVDVFMKHGFFGMEGKLNSGDAHLAVDYEYVLKNGLIAYEQRVNDLLEKLDLCVVENIDKYQFYKAVLIVIQAVKTYALRYSKLALELSKSALGPRKKELLEISHICTKVPYMPATTYHEAIQSTWFIQLILQIESNGHSLSYGRFDQYMNPFYLKDRKEKRITEDQASELLTNLWIKTMTINKIRSQSHTFSSAGSPMYQNVTVGGQTPDKKDATNEMSYLVLKSVAQTKLPQPNLTVRYHRNMPSDFMNEAIEVMKLGTGMPAFNNDEIIIPSFIEKGVSEEDAYNYSAIGCVETAVPGKWGYRCTGMSYINFPKILLIVMNDGIDPTSKDRFIEGSGNFREMHSFDELMQAIDKALREITRMSVIVENAIDLALEREVPDVLCSALTQDCIGRGKTIKEGGAIYDFISGLQVGIANMADSLAAIKKLVFEEKKISCDQLMDALEDDFSSEKSKKVQQLLIYDAPKYGNDDDYADQLVVDVYQIYIDEMKKYPNTRHQRGPIGGIRYAGTSSISANVGQGFATMATPDGRKARAPLAEGCSPSHSMDQNGPTAIFKSVSKLPTKEITGGVLLNQKVTPQMLESNENNQKLQMMIKTFFNRLDGYHVQYNVVSKETLIDAQIHPEDHRDLIVRVAGYSAFFNVLSKATQDDIIERTEQTI
ncbi:glycyl radical protein [Tannockella kyphosi]|uniref:glycyl radical protein n=1 Tax=Tannockella kyphosi TaxID=2899121 RepID=UPI002010D42A|nr:glycyl radical protein [Tannockella kyphosi]